MLVLLLIYMCVLKMLPYCDPSFRSWTGPELSGEGTT